MEKSYEVLKKAIEKTGVKKVALDLRLSTALIYKWCQDASEDPKKIIPSGSQNPLDRIQKIYEVTKDKGVISWICQMAGGFFVKNPQPKNIVINEDFLQNTQSLIHEFSEALQTISESFHNDRAISDKEAQKIRREWEDVKQVGECLVLACESGAFNSEGEA